MDSRAMNSKSIKLNTLIAWAIVASSIVSCSSRADYNIAIGYLILLLRSLTSTEKLRLAIKGSIHIILVSIIFDIIWIFQYIILYWKWGLGIGDWGLGIGDWGLGPIPNPQSPIPNPHKYYFWVIIK